MGFHCHFGGTYFLGRFAIGLVSYVVCGFFYWNLSLHQKDKPQNTTSGFDGFYPNGLGHSTALVYIF
jgi:hypothetical protein